MKVGQSLVQVATELERQQAVKRDFVADTRKLGMSSEASTVTIDSGNERVTVGLNRLAQTQLAGRLDLPVPVYDRLQSKYPAELAYLVNAMFNREPQKMLVRTLDGNARSFMSDGYRPLDNYDLFEAIFPTLQEYVKEGLRIESVALTETRLYIKAVAPWLTRELEVPEGLVMGKGHTFFLRRVFGSITIANSEVGASLLAIDPGVFEEQCTNLATFRKEGYGRVHVGKRKGVEGEAFEYSSDQTKRLEDAVVWARARDAVKATLDGRVFQKITDRMVAARADQITGDPAKVVEVFSKKQGLNETERGGLLRLLAGSGEMTRYGLQWAVTRLAGETEDYDRASDLEALGGKVIELPKSEWKVLAEAA